MIRFSIALDALRRQLERPGENHCRDEPDREDNHDRFVDVGLVIENPEQDIDDLEDQPGDADVTDGYAKYAAALEFGEERHQQKYIAPTGRS